MGVTVYYPGVPCANGHVGRRWAGSRACAECASAKAKSPKSKVRAKELRPAWKIKERAATVRRKRDPNNWVAYLIIGARHRAKKAGLEFSITATDVTLTDVCPVLGLRLEMGLGNGWQDNSPSLDRVDNSKGYIPGNVRIISYRANALKRDASLAEVEAIAAYMRGSL